jgi:hypothetical protein
MNVEGKKYIYIRALKENSHSRNQRVWRRSNLHLMAQIQFQNI